MENSKVKNLKKIIIGAAIALIAGGTSPWWWEYIDPTPPPPPPEKEVHKQGNQTIKFEGVHIPPSSNNTSDTYIFGLLDLDTGNRTNSKNTNTDLEISINANKLLITMTLKEGALIGATRTSFSKCNSLLKNNSGRQLVINNKKAPTHYYCTETTDGRISQFQIRSIKKYNIPGNNMYSIHVNIKYTTWKL